MSKNKTKKINIVDDKNTKLLVSDLIIPSGDEMTKKWRLSFFNGSVSGGIDSMKCEHWQRKNIETITNNKCDKTQYRINMDTGEMKLLVKVNILDDEFEWTENFDGQMLINNKKVLFNFKMVCDCGGSQTRTIREVYHFIKSQKKFILKNADTNFIFINILDGDTLYNKLPKIKKLLSNDIKNKIYIGDTKNFKIWYDEYVIS